MANNGNRHNNNNNNTRRLRLNGISPLTSRKSYTSRPSTKQIMMATSPPMLIDREWKKTHADMLELRLKRNRVPNFEVSVEELRCCDALEKAQLNQETRKEPMHIRYADKTAMQEPKLPARTALGVFPGVSYKPSQSSGLVVIKFRISSRRDELHRAVCIVKRAFFFGASHNKSTRHRDPW